MATIQIGKDENQIEHQDVLCLLGMRNGYIGKYPADTKARAVVRYLVNKPDYKKRLAVTRQLRKQYELVSSGKGYNKQ